MFFFSLQILLFCLILTCSSEYVVSIGFRMLIDVSHPFSRFSPYQVEGYEGALYVLVTSLIL